MNRLEAYLLYIALKVHFSTDYDYFKMRGKTSASPKSFEARKDQFFFAKLAKHRDPVNFLVSNFVEHGSNIWVGDLIWDSEYDRTYMAWLKVQESLSYAFTIDLRKLPSDPAEANKLLLPQKNDFPELLNMYLLKEIRPETLVILDRVMGFIKRWDETVTDKIVYPELILKIKKYSPFVDYDKDKARDLLWTHLT